MLSLVPLAFRSWKNSRSLACLCILALAIGIGCTTAIFTVVDAVLLKPPPYRDGHRWVALFGGRTTSDEQSRYEGLSTSDLVSYEQRTRSFDAFGWFRIGGDFNLTSPGQAQHLNGVEVTPSLVNEVGVAPVRGRLFQQSDGEDVALLSDRLWRRLGGNASLIGRPITLDGRVLTVIGVMPSWFRLPIIGVSNQEARNDVWIPVQVPRNEAERRGNSSFAGYARLKPGVSVEQGRADAKRVAVGIASDDPGNHRSYTAVLFSLRESVVKDVRPTLLLLFAAAGLLLLITCANVAGLLLIRAVGRARETAIRVALGGSRGQLALQFFWEGLLVALAAAALGVVASIALVRVVVSLAAEYIPFSDEISLNWMAVSFAAGMAFLTAVLSALAPLWQAMHTQPGEALNDGLRASAGARSRRLSRALVIAEVALAFTLLSVSALLIFKLRDLGRSSPGFAASHLLTFQISLTGNRYPNSSSLSAYQEGLLQTLRAVPGVHSAALANQLPLAGCCFSSNLFPEAQRLAPDVTSSISLMTVTADYFKTMQIPLRRGRLLNQRDTNENPTPMVIDEAAAKRYWPGRDAVGAYGRISTPDGSRVQVVGVVGDVRNQGLGQIAMPETYFINALRPSNPMQFVVRSDREDAALIAEIRAALRKADPSQPIYAVRSMDQIVANSLTFERLSAVVLGFFTAAALLLAALGIFGVTSYSVRQRTVEIGTRMALGATSSDLLWLVMGDGVTMAVYGLLAGAAIVAAVLQVIQQAFHLQQAGPLPYLYAVGTVTALALFSSFFPAWRSTLLSPTAAIRNESDTVWTTARRELERSLGWAPPGTEADVVDSALLIEFIEAIRRAGSFREALHTSLALVRNRMQAHWAVLLAKSAGGSFTCVAADPESPTGPLTLPEDGFLLNRLQSYASPLAFTRHDLETCLRWALEQKPRHVAEIEALQQHGACLAIALQSKEGVAGLLLLGAPTGGNAYTSGQKNLLQACSEQFALMIENARLTERIVEQDKLRRDVALAAEVQQRLLPATTPNNATISTGAFTLPVRSVGGDYYDFLEVGEDQVGIALADVAGKGIAAALIMAVVHASLRIVAAESGTSLPALAARMNSYLHRSTGFSSYATFFYAQFDAKSRQLRYVNAGHNPPFLLRVNRDGPDAPIEELTTGGMIIGMFPVAAYEEAAVDVRPGDVLLAFTDGVTEALNPNDEEFGEERLKALLRRVAPLPVEQITVSISEELRRWIAEAPQHDDLTFLVVKV